MSLWVYILECSDGLLYTGVTNDIDRRYAEHQQGINPDCFTFIRRPVELKYAEKFSNNLLAIDWEKRIKKWSAKKKRALIEDNWEELQKLAVCRNETHWKKKEG